MSDKSLEQLKEILHSMKRVAIAYSGGVDSALLLRVAKDSLLEEIIAIVNVSPLNSADDVDNAIMVARSMNIEPLITYSNPLNDPYFRSNPIDRCYYCKKSMLNAIINMAKDRGIECVIEGSHRDDLDCDRPGNRAIAELGVRSPLREVGLDKKGVRRLAKKLSIPSADRPSSPCLITRIPFNQEVSEEALKTVEKAESALKELGFEEVRVRHHGTIARIEVPRNDMIRLINLYDKVVEKLNRTGFIYVTVDLQGIRSGSMSEALASNTNRHNDV
ncbi:MAG: ATP-dependent sacrificial sulfur transferase LarE [Euryarchaeota archaeon]|nr:ATP-dependent sacrificial sulfur transferase LarE [Euryarchaeota archaeon]